MVKWVELLNLIAERCDELMISYLRIERNCGADERSEIEGKINDQDDTNHVLITTIYVTFRSSQRKRRPEKAETKNNDLTIEWQSAGGNGEDEELFVYNFENMQNKNRFKTGK